MERSESNRVNQNVQARQERRKKVYRSHGTVREQSGKPQLASEENIQCTVHRVLRHWRLYHEGSGQAH